MTRVFLSRKSKTILNIFYWLYFNNVMRISFCHCFSTVFAQCAITGIQRENREKWCFRCCWSKIDVYFLSNEIEVALLLFYPMGLKSTSSVLITRPGLLTNSSRCVQEDHCRCRVCWVCHRESGEPTGPNIGVRRHSPLAIGQDINWVGVGDNMI